jgi:MoxR-like ATPase
MAQAAVTAEPEAVAEILSAADVLRLQQTIHRVAVPAHVLHYAVRLVRATRVHEGENPDFVYEWISQGAGPRALAHLTLAAKVRAALRGRPVTSTGDVRNVVYPTLRHRLITNRNARSKGITADRVIARLLEDIPQRLSGDDLPPQENDVANPERWFSTDI